MSSEDGWTSAHDLLRRQSDIETEAAARRATAAVLQPDPDRCIRTIACNKPKGHIGRCRGYRFERKQVRDKPACVFCGARGPHFPFCRRHTETQICPFPGCGKPFGHIGRCPGQHRGQKRKGMNDGDST